VDSRSPHRRMDRFRSNRCRCDLKVCLSHDSSSRHQPRTTALER
jgi:hypothetical protein